ncbi:hypothetical protein FZ934_12455 [Rhizobium grahamii]|uniref:Uncharacterized protein n=1 Tax=Rhizobium grahamii TaxID=1120045 RepID=A0A5Q0CF45_9HYPH|nr:MULTISPECIES: hypothetical protein [Rhizobium]QFY62449.1 hypothetical protein FZ934_12455 [Rhizobium grahamii]QRM51363.1 hypothetical protein F3Y33_10435 [Rhizobium sp. BG6]
MMDAVLQQIVNDALTKGPTSLVPRHVALRRPIDIVNSRVLSAHDKRAILAAWASDYYAVGSEPSLRKIPGTPEPVTVDEVHSALLELDRRFSI